MKVQVQILLGFIASFFAVSLLQAETTTIASPKALKVIQPSLPYEVASYKLDATAMVRFKLDASGRPVDIRVEDTNSSAFAESVVRAVREWRYEVPEGYQGEEYRLPVSVRYGA